MNKYIFKSFLLIFALVTLNGCKKESTSNAASTNSILSFSFSKLKNASLSSDVFGVINGENIEISVPANTNITALIPSIVHNGKLIDPDTTVSKNFTQPVLYTVTADDNSKKVYTVTVRMPLTNDKSITSFIFSSADNPSLTDDVTGIITGNTIELKVPNGTDITNLKPSINFLGASINPNSGIAQNFTNPVSYKVTASNGSFINYIVTVKVAKVSPVIKDIYLVGSEYTGATHRAKYWKNGVATYLSNSASNVVANSIFVQNNDIYVAGTGTSSSNGNDFAIAWKNGVVVNLQQGSFGSAEAIQVVGNDVHIVGRNNNNAVYWKNGLVETTLSTNISWAEAIQVVGNDVYIAGTIYDGIKNIGVYWKNGVQINVPNASSISAIQVVGNDVYLAGYVHNGAYYTVNYWKNGVKTQISSADAYGADANAIYVVDNDVYVAGFVGSRGVLWKNKTETALTSGVTVDDAAATSVIVLGDDVYVSGFEYNTAKFWKNSIKTDINSGKANSMFITTY